MKIERERKGFEPLVLRIATREDFDVLFGMAGSCSKGAFNNTLSRNNMVYRCNIYEKVEELYSQLDRLRKEFDTK